MEIIANTKKQNFTIKHNGKTMVTHSMPKSVFKTMANDMSMYDWANWLIDCSGCYKVVSSLK